MQIRLIDMNIYTNVIDLFIDRKVYQNCIFFFLLLLNLKTRRCYICVHFSGKIEDF